MDLDLARFADFSVTGLKAPPTPAAGLAPGEPSLMDLELIDFDPEQPRKRLKPGTLEEMADSMRLHGVLQAISLRPHPSIAGRYMVRMGERRVRAARMAGLVKIPYLLDAAPPDRYAQVAENVQREDMDPFDLAAFVAQCEAAGDTRAEIARRLGYRSRSFITEVAGLIAAPPSLVVAYDAGRIGDSRLLYRLVRIAKRSPDVLAVALAGEGSITEAGIDAATGRAVTAPVEPAETPTEPAVEVPSQVMLGTAQANTPRAAALPQPPQPDLPPSAALGKHERASEAEHAPESAPRTAPPVTPTRATAERPAPAQARMRADEAAEAVPARTILAEHAGRIGRVDQCHPTEAHATALLLDDGTRAIVAWAELRIVGYAAGVSGKTA